MRGENPADERGEQSATEPSSKTSGSSVTLTSGAVETSHGTNRSSEDGAATNGTPSSGPSESGSEAGSVSVIIPTYNESDNIAQIISRCLETLSESPFATEILVLDDDSDDYTWQYPRRLFGHDPRVRVVRRTAEEPGLARSVAHGFAIADADYCAVIDADLQHPPEQLPELVSALEDGADVAIGSRYVDGGDIRNWSAFRKVVSSVGSAAARLALPAARSISDPMSGFFAIRREVIDDVDLDPQGYKILLEVLARGNYDSVAEVPYVFHERERGESNLTLSEYRRFVEHLGEVAVVGRGLERAIDPKRVVRAAEFGAVGASGTGVNMVVFAALTVLGSAHFLFAGIVAFLAAVNWNFAGNWLLTYERPEGDVRSQYVRFNLVSATGFAAYLGTLTVAVVGGIPALVANAFAILVGAGVNFAGTEGAVFRREATADPGENVDGTGEVRS